MLDADDLCFLIMDLSGRAVARFGGLGANAARSLQQGADHAPVVPLPGTVYEKVLRSQQPDLRADGSRAVTGSSCRSPTAATPWV